MPRPREGERETDFVSRCVPVVMHEGTADNPSQAAAICHSMWRNRKAIRTELSVGMRVELVQPAFDARGNAHEPQGGKVGAVRGDTVQIKLDDGGIVFVGLTEVEPVKGLTGSSGSAGGYTIPPGDWLRAAYAGDRKALEYYATKSAMTELIGEQGGYLVPPQVVDHVCGLVADTSLLWQRAWVEPMATMETDVPVIDRSIAPTIQGLTGNYGSFSMCWGENPVSLTLVESEPKFAQVALKARLLSAFAVCSNSLLVDSRSITAFLENMAVAAVHWFTTQAFLCGTGIGQPLGMATPSNPALLTVQEVDGAFNKNLADMVGKLTPDAFERAIWFMHPRYYSKYLSRQAAGDTVPSNAGTNYRWQYCNGMPVIPTDALGAPNPTDSNSGPSGPTGPFTWTDGIGVALVDPLAYIIGDRRMMEVAFSPHPRFTNYQTVLRITMRLDGRPMYRQPFTLPDLTTQVSPYVGLLSL